jgi:hypothetical protein
MNTKPGHRGTRDGAIPAATSRRFLGKTEEETVAQDPDFGLRLTGRYGLG